LATEVPVSLTARYILIVPCFLIIISACGGSSPESTAKQYLSAVKDGNFATAYDLIDSGTRERLSASEYSERANVPLRLEDFKIRSVTVDGDTATVEAAITRPDTSSLIRDVLSSAFSGGSIPSDDEIEKKAKDLPRVTTVEELDLVREPSGWRVVPRSFQEAPTKEAAREDRPSVPPARSGAQRSAAQTAATAWDEVDLTGASMRVTEQNNSWWRFSYVLAVDNPSGETFSVDFHVKFLDEDGFIIDDDRLRNQVVRPGENQFTGYDLINANIAPRVERMTSTMTRR
jgi:hypothetical protein